MVKARIWGTGRTKQWVSGEKKTLGIVSSDGWTSNGGGLFIVDDKLTVKPASSGIQCMESIADATGRPSTPDPYLSTLNTTHQTLNAEHSTLHTTETLNTELP